MASFLSGYSSSEPRALLADGRAPTGIQRLEAMDGVPALNKSAQPHPWNRQIQPTAILTAVVRKTPNQLLSSVAPPLAVTEDRLERKVIFMPNVVMSEVAPGSVPPPIRFTEKLRPFTLQRYAISISLNAETANTPEGRAIVLAQISSMAKSALNTMEMMIIGTLMRSSETASSIAFLDGDKSESQAKHDALAYFKQVGIINKDPTAFINLVEKAKRQIVRYGGKAKVAIVPTGLMQKLSGTADYNQYNLAGRGRNVGSGVPDYNRLCGLNVIEHSDCGADTRGNLQQMLRRTILVGEYYPKYEGKETQIFDADVGDWRTVSLDKDGDVGIIIRNFIQLQTSSVIICSGGTDFASMAFRLATSMAGMNAGTMGGIKQFAMHAAACTWKPFECATIDDVEVHDCISGAGSSIVHSQVLAAHKANGGSIDFRKIVSEGVPAAPGGGGGGGGGMLQASCIFWDLMATAADGGGPGRSAVAATRLLNRVPRIFDVCGQDCCGPTRDRTDAQFASALGLEVPAQPKSNGFNWASCMANSAVVLGSYKVVDGTSIHDHKNAGPLSGLEHNMSF